MIRMCAVSLLTVGVCCWMGSAHSQSPPPKPPEAKPAGRIEISRDRIVPLLGHEVKNPEGTVVGQITNILIDADGHPVVAILDYGGFLGVGHRKIAVSIEVLRFSPGDTSTVSLTLKLDQLKAFPEYKPEGKLVVATSPAGTDTPR